jgi:hypothetical protein
MRSEDYALIGDLRTAALVGRNDSTAADEIVAGHSRWHTPWEAS